MKEPTIGDVLIRLDKVDSDIKQLSERVEKLDYHFTTYQQANKQIVNLAFALIASATVTVLVGAVFK